MASQITEEEDNIVVEDLRGKLQKVQFFKEFFLDYIFGPMHFTRLDVVSTSIMRGRWDFWNYLMERFKLKYDFLKLL